MRNRNELLLSENEAIARGAYEAGVAVAARYPGTPSSEILESLAQYDNEVYCEWAPNEKVAMEGSYRGIPGGCQIYGYYETCRIERSR